MHSCCYLTAGQGGRHTSHTFRLKLVPKQFEVLPFLSAFTASWHESPRNPLCFCKEVYIYIIYTKETVHKEGRLVN